MFWELFAILQAIIGFTLVWGRQVMLENTRARFEATSWTLLDALQQGDESQQAEAMEQLIRIYWPAVYAFIRRKGKSRDEAADLTQQFFTHKVIDRGILGGAERSRGRLRSLLCKSVERFMLNEQSRKSTAFARKMLSGEQLDAEESLINTQPARDSVHAFDQRWALSVLNEALRRTEGELRREGREDHWKAFEDRVLHAARSSTRPPSYLELADRYHFPTPASATAAIQRVRARLQRAMSTVVAESLPGGSVEDIEEETNWVISLLGG